MVKKSKRIGSALDLQRHLEAMFFAALESGDIRAAGYAAQLWISAEGHAKEERKQKDDKNTPLDNLCKILEKARKELREKEREHENKE